MKYWGGGKIYKIIPTTYPEMQLPQRTYSLPQSNTNIQLNNISVG